MARPGNILITGCPGAGKTTLIVKLDGMLQHHQPVGFFTQEIRRDGERVGFEAVSLDGEHQMLSHADIHSRERVGKYGVDVAAFEYFLSRIDWTGRSLVIIDEIGRMECLSRQFRGLVKQLLDSTSVVIATVARRGSGFIADTRHRPDCLLYDVTRANRNELAAVISNEAESLMEELP